MLYSSWITPAPFGLANKQHGHGPMGHSWMQWVMTSYGFNGLCFSLHRTGHVTPSHHDSWPLMTPLLQVPTQGHWQKIRPPFTRCTTTTKTKKKQAKTWHDIKGVPTTKTKTPPPWSSSDLGVFFFGGGPKKKANRSPPGEIVGLSRAPRHVDQAPRIDPEHSRMQDGRGGTRRGSTGVCFDPNGLQGGW